MTHDQFLEFVQEHQQKTLELMDKKNRDYAGGGQSAFSNFYEEAQETGVTPAVVWYIYAKKHWRAIQKFVRDGQVESEPIEGRLHDIINYCYLLLGIIEEKKPKKTAEERLSEMLHPGQK